jgi:hypothetical protein
MTEINWSLVRFRLPGYKSTNSPAVRILRFQRSGPGSIPGWCKTPHTPSNPSTKGRRVGPRPLTKRRRVGPRPHDNVAQWIAYQPSELGVAGSSPVIVFRKPTFPNPSHPVHGKWGFVPTCSVSSVG